jgi:hypothetical protein
MAINSVQVFDVLSTQRKPKMLTLSALGTTGVQEVTVITAAADVAGSLNNTFFDYTTPSNSYRFWFNVSAGGVAPAAGGGTLSVIAISTGDLIGTVATAVKVAMDAKSDIVATVLTNDVTATNVADGVVADCVDGSAATGFTFVTSVQGVTSLVALEYGKFDATIAESGTGAGDYTITLNEPMVQVPQVIVQTTTSRAARIVSATKSVIRIATKNLSGTLTDADFSVMILGSLDTDLIN